MAYREMIFKERKKARESYDDPVTPTGFEADKFSGQKLRGQIFG